MTRGPKKPTWLEKKASEESHVQFESCLHLLNVVMRIREELQQPSSTLFQVRDDLKGLWVVGEHLDLEHLGRGGLERIAVEPVGHGDGRGWRQSGQ